MSDLYAGRLRRLCLVWRASGLLPFSSPITHRHLTLKFRVSAAPRLCDLALGLGLPHLPLV